MTTHVRLYVTPVMFIPQPSIWFGFVKLEDVCFLNLGCWNTLIVAAPLKKAVESAPPSAPDAAAFDAASRATCSVGNRATSSSRVRSLNAASTDTCVCARASCVVSMTKPSETRMLSGRNVASTRAYFSLRTPRALIVGREAAAVGSDSASVNTLLG